MSRGRKALLVVVALTVLVIGGAVAYLRPIAPIATGYAAKLTCSGHHVSGRPVADVQADLPANPLVPFLRTDVDEDRARTTLLGLWASTAWHTPGYGCTLAEERPDLPPAPAVPAPAAGLPWPEGDAPPAPGAEGVDLARVEGALDAAFEEEGLAGDPDGRVRGTRAVAVAHDGRLVAERYADGFDAGTPLLGWSMGKSIANAIVGRIARESGADLDALLARDDLRPEWEGDERATITLHHLLTMTDGLDFAEVYEPGTDATRMLFTPQDTAAFAAERPLAATPGTRHSYSSGTTNLLCAAADELARDAGLPAAPTMAHELVFAPLGMTSAVLEPDASDGLVCSSFPYATARDWARFGQLYLDDGVWAGERLLPEGWVAYSTTPVEAEGVEHGYGAQWWLNDRGDGTVRMPSVPADAFWASGNEGQQVVVIPSAGLVVVRLGLAVGFAGVDWGLEPLLAEVVAAVSG
jgi:CubicO group peptidase (beta-lactamase class C family)